MQITVKNIHKSLNENGYICGVPFAASITSAIKTKPVSGAFLYGPAGTGKSFLPITLSKTLGIEMFFYQCAPGTREDDLVLKMFPSENTKSGVEIKKSTVFKAAEASHKKPVMLVLDEWDKTRPTADGFFLDFLQYGRLSIPGSEINANLENMFIFFTANDERDFHEALLRRFPKIDVNPLAPSLVMSALMLTHDGHPHLGNAIKLYEQAVMSGMSKPATIQEIRQLLDAISFLGEGSNWNDLVYQYVTKTPENHKLLFDAKDVEYTDITDSVELDVDSFTGEMHNKKKEKKNKVLMPKKVQYHTSTKPVENDKDMPKDSEIYGMYDYDDTNYSIHAHQSMAYGKVADDTSNVNEFEVMHGKLIRKKPLQLLNVGEYIQKSRRINGEVVFVDSNCKRTDLRWMPRWQEWQIRRCSKTEVVARYIHTPRNEDDADGFTLDMRWTDTDGLVLICTSQRLNSIARYFKAGRTKPFLTSDSWLTDRTGLAIANDIRSIRQLGLLNIRNLINHTHIQYSEILHNDDTLPACFTQVVGGASSINDTGDFIEYNSKGFTMRINTNSEYIDYLKISIDIHGTPTHTALQGLSELSKQFHRYDYGEGIPVYKAVTVNSKKISAHLKPRGWKPQGRSRRIMSKCYRSLRGYPINLYFMDDIAIFSYKFKPYNDNKDVRVFSNAVKTVNQLAKSVENIG